MRKILIHGYFDKYGFDNGDDLALLAQARRIRRRVAGLLNKEFERRGLPYRAEVRDVCGVHNPVRMILTWQEGDYSFQWCLYYGIRRFEMGISCGSRVGDGPPPGASDILASVQLRLDR